MVSFVHLFSDNTCRAVGSIFIHVIFIDKNNVDENTSYNMNPTNKEILKPVELSTN